jgi:hypothetical protein
MSLSRGYGGFKTMHGKHPTPNPEGQWPRESCHQRCLRYFVTCVHILLYGGILGGSGRDKAGKVAPKNHSVRQPSMLLRDVACCCSRPNKYLAGEHLQPRPYSHRTILYVTVESRILKVNGRRSLPGNVENQLFNRPQAKERPCGARSEGHGAMLR